MATALAEAPCFGEGDVLNNTLLGGLRSRGKRVMEVVVRAIGICCETAEGDSVRMEKRLWDMCCTHGA